MTEAFNILNRYDDRSYINMKYLQNSTYLLTASPNNMPAKRIKHKKSYPWKEQDKLKDALFHIGTDDPIKKITINGTQIDIGMTICREHFIYTPTRDTIKNNLPFIQTIVSDSVHLKQERLFGALNIYMDSSKKLLVYLNTAHPKYNANLEVKAYLYADIHGLDFKIETPVRRYENKIAPQTDSNINNNKTTTTTTNNSVTTQIPSTFGGLKAGFFEKNKKPSTTNSIATKKPTSFGGLKTGFFEKNKKRAATNTTNKNPTTFGGLKAGFLTK